MTRRTSRWSVFALSRQRSPVTSNKYETSAHDESRIWLSCIWSIETRACMNNIIKPRMNGRSLRSVTWSTKESLWFKWAETQDSPPEMNEIEQGRVLLRSANCFSTEKSLNEIEQSRVLLRSANYFSIEKSLNEINDPKRREVLWEQQAVAGHRPAEISTPNHETGLLRSRPQETPSLNRARFAALSGHIQGRTKLFGITKSDLLQQIYACESHTLSCYDLWSVAPGTREHAKFHRQQRYGWVCGRWCGDRWWSFLGLTIQQQKLTHSWRRSRRTLRKAGWRQGERWGEITNDRWTKEACHKQRLVH